MDDWENEFRIREHLRAVLDIKGGWEALLSVIWSKRIVANLKRAREAAMVTLEEVSKHSGIPAYRLAEIEGDDIPDVDVMTLNKWTMALDALVPERMEVCS
jgi:hypothetical protein